MGDYIKAQSRDVHVVQLKDEKKLRHFAGLVERIERRRNRVLDKGVFKIEAPRHWVADQVNFRDVNHHFPLQYETWQSCVDQEETGCFVRVTEAANQTTKEEFQALATREARQPPPGESGRMTISRFFIRRQRHTQKRVVSGTVTGSRFSDYSNAFDLRNLRSVLNLGTMENGQLRQEPGITTPEIVYGSYGSTTPLQTGYLGLHDFVERDVNNCQNPLQHPQWIVSPSFLRRHKIKFSTVVQEAGDILVILPRAYFMAFNCGFNMVESVQFATPRWVEIGKRLRPSMCDCRPIWLNPDDLDAAYIEYQRRRHLERGIRKLKEEIGRLRTELDKERRGCPLRHPHRLRQRRAPGNEEKLAGQAQSRN